MSRRVVSQRERATPITKSAAADTAQKISAALERMAAVLEKHIPQDIATSSDGLAPKAAMGNKEVFLIAEAINIGTRAMEYMSMESVRTS